ncbi:MAG TPA: PAS domain S-box protein, partial [Blastocatellia bacterium]|nr:PAS domain S-box protein [Blastocatellia bacterium]
LEMRLEQGLVRLTEGDIDLVLLDLSLPGSEGLETLLTTRQQAPQLPIIVLTGSGDSEMGRHAMAAGAQDYLIKWEMDHRLLQQTMRYAIERKRSEIAQQDHERTIRKIAEALPEIIVLIEPETGRMTFINDQVTRTLGYSIAEAQTLSYNTLVHPDDQQRLNEHFNRLLAELEENDREIEYRVKHANGEWRWLDGRHIAYGRRQGGRRVQILCAAHDATERKRAESELSQSEARYRDLVENSGLFIGTLDAEGRILSANQSVLKFLGIKRIEDLAGRKIADFLPPESQLAFQRYFRRLLKKGEASGTGRFTSPSGKEIALEFTNTLRHDSSDSMIIRCIGRDVTEQAQAKAALHESEERVRFALDAAGLGAWEWKIDSDKMVEDEVSRQLIGNQAGGLEGFLSRVIPEDREQVRARIEQALASRQHYSLEFRVFKPDGQIRWIETQARLMCTPGGQPVRLVGVVRDVTEKKRLEAEIYRTQRLESIGALASGIAHDLNNVLAPILMALHTLQQRFTDEYSQRWLSLVRRSAERGRDLIEQMIAFAKGASGERTPLQLQLLTEDLVKILHETLPRNVELEVRIPDDLWIVVGDGTQIHQVLMNLCINARDAMPGGGKLSMGAANLTLGEDEIGHRSEVKPGRFIRITIADTGVGISPQIFDRIFDPFFTTKEKGKGTGLGLSTVLGIARGHGGFIEVESEVARGSQFHVYLPAREVFVPGPKETPAPAPLNGHGELILVVDDEPNICELAKHTLESCGYRVLAADDGQAALEIFHQHKDEIQVVLTDMMMPNLDGPATIRALKHLAPQVRIIATSGIRSTSTLAELAKTEIDIFLPKPYTTETLLSVLSDLLAR